MRDAGGGASAVGGGGVGGVGDGWGMSGRTRVIKLTRVNGDRSFGFSIRGGREHGTGFFISNVEIGSQAYNQGLRAGDQVVRVNNMNIEQSIHREVTSIIQYNSIIHLHVKSTGIIPLKENRGDPLTWLVVEDDSELSDHPSDYPSNHSTSTHNSNTSNEQNYFLRPDNFARLYINYNAKVGLGCSICKGPPEKPGIFVQSVQVGGVARNSGLRPGDQIIACNDVPFINLEFAEAVYVLKSSARLVVDVLHGAGMDLIAGESSGYNSSASSVAGDTTPPSSSYPTDSISSRLNAVSRNLILDRSRGWREIESEWAKAESMIEKKKSVNQKTLKTRAQRDASHRISSMNSRSLSNLNTAVYEEQRTAFREPCCSPQATHAALRPAKSTNDLCGGINGTNYATDCKTTFDGTYPATDRKTLNGTYSATDHSRATKSTNNLCEGINGTNYATDRKTAFDATYPATDHNRVTKSTNNLSDEIGHGTYPATVHKMPLDGTYRAADHKIALLTSSDCHVNKIVINGAPKNERDAVLRLDQLSGTTPSRTSTLSSGTSKITLQSSSTSSPDHTLLQKQLQQLHIQQQRLQEEAHRLARERQKFEEEKRRGIERTHSAPLVINCDPRTLNTDPHTLNTPSRTLNQPPDTQHTLNTPTRTLNRAPDTQRTLKASDTQRNLNADQRTFNTASRKLNRAPERPDDISRTLPKPLETSQTFSNPHEISRTLPNPSETSRNTARHTTKVHIKSPPPPPPPRKTSTILTTPDNSFGGLATHPPAQRTLSTPCSTSQNFQNTPEGPKYSHRGPGTPQKYSQDFERGQIGTQGPSHCPHGPAHCPHGPSHCPQAPTTHSAHPYPQRDNLRGQKHPQKYSPGFERGQKGIQSSHTPSNCPHTPTSHPYPLREKSRGPRTPQISPPSSPANSSSSSSGLGSVEIGPRRCKSIGEISASSADSFWEDRSGDKSLLHGDRAFAHTNTHTDRRTDPRINAHGAVSRIRLNAHDLNSYKGSLRDLNSINVHTNIHTENGNILNAYTENVHTENGYRHNTQTLINAQTENGNILNAYTNRHTGNGNNLNAYTENGHNSSIYTKNTQTFINAHTENGNISNSYTENGQNPNLYTENGNILNVYQNNTQTLLNTNIENGQNLNTNIENGQNLNTDNLNSHFSNSDILCTQPNTSRLMPPHPPPKPGAPGMFGGPAVPRGAVISGGPPSPPPPPPGLISGAPKPTLADALKRELEMRRTKDSGDGNDESKMQNFEDKIDAMKKDRQNSAQSEKQSQHDKMMAELKSAYKKKFTKKDSVDQIERTEQRNEQGRENEQPTQNSEQPAEQFSSKIINNSLINENSGTILRRPKMNETVNETANGTMLRRTEVNKNETANKTANETANGTILRKPGTILNNEMNSGTILRRPELNKNETMNETASKTANETASGTILRKPGTNLNNGNNGTILLKTKNEAMTKTSNETVNETTNGTILRKPDTNLNEINSGTVLRRPELNKQINSKSPVTSASLGSSTMNEAKNEAVNGTIGTKNGTTVMNNSIPPPPPPPPPPQHLKPNRSQLTPNSQCSQTVQSPTSHSATPAGAPPSGLMTPVPQGSPRVTPDGPPGSVVSPLRAPLAQQTERAGDNSTSNSSSSSTFTIPRLRPVSTVTAKVDSNPQPITKQPNKPLVSITAYPSANARPTPVKLDFLPSKTDPGKMDPAKMDPVKSDPTVKSEPRDFDRQFSRESLHKELASTLSRANLRRGDSPLRNEESSSKNAENFTVKINENSMMKSTENFTVNHDRNSGSKIAGNAHSFTVNIGVQNSDGSNEGSFVKLGGLNQGGSTQRLRERFQSNVNIGEGSGGAGGSKGPNMSSSGGTGGSKGPNMSSSGGTGGSKGPNTSGSGGTGGSISSGGYTTTIIQTNPGTGPTASLSSKYQGIGQAKPVTIIMKGDTTPDMEYPPSILKAPHPPSKPILGKTISFGDVTTVGDEEERFEERL